MKRREESRNILDQGSVSFFYNGLASKYFRVCESHTVSVVQSLLFTIFKKCKSHSQLEAWIWLTGRRLCQPMSQMKTPPLGQIRGEKLQPAKKTEKSWLMLSISSLFYHKQKSSLSIRLKFWHIDQIALYCKIRSYSMLFQKINF